MALRRDPYESSVCMNFDVPQASTLRERGHQLGQLGDDTSRLRARLDDKTAKVLWHACSRTSVVWWWVGDGAHVVGGLHSFFIRFHDSATGA